MSARYICWADLSGERTYSAASPEAAARMYAEAEAQDSGDAGDGEELTTTWAEVLVRLVGAAEADYETVDVPLHPAEPPCAAGQSHDWGEPGVYPSGGLVGYRCTCLRCGWERDVDPAAPNPETGAPGRSVTYTRRRTP